MMRTNRPTRFKFLLCAALLAAAMTLTVSGTAQEASGDGPTELAPSGDAPVAGPADVPAVPGALDEGMPALPKKLLAPGGPASEGLRVTIGPSDKALDPIAIPDSLCPDGSKEACATVTDTMRNALRISGYFKTLPPKTYIADMASETLAKTNWPDWNNVGASYLIKTSVEAKGTGSYDLSMRFYNVVDKRTVTLNKQDRKGLSRDDLRRAVLQFCNEVVEYVSGKPGVFGSRILYAVKTGLRTKAIGSMEMDGHGAGGIIGGSTINMLPSWAPGGGVLYTSFKTGRPSVWLGKKRLAEDGHQYRRARFAPGGDAIAVSVDMGGQSDIWLMSPGGELLQNLTKHWADEVSPTWSPDGSKIAFVSNRSGGPQIYVMGRDGSGARRLTMAGSYNSTPDWGPNGLIVFAGMDEGRSDIFTVDIGGHITRLTQDQGNNRDPSWAPNGQYLAFVSDREGGSHMWIMTADGRYQYRVGKKGGVSTPCWSP